MGENGTLIAEQPGPNPLEDGVVVASRDGVAVAGAPDAGALHAIHRRARSPADGVPAARAGLHARHRRRASRLRRTSPTDCVARKCSTRCANRRSRDGRSSSRDRAAVLPRDPSRDDDLRDPRASVPQPVARQPRARRRAARPARTSTCARSTTSTPTSTSTSTPSSRRSRRRALVVWMHPVYWYSVPALLKHWFDKVLALGWAYGEGGTALRGKHCLWVPTTGGDEDDVRAGGHARASVRELRAGDRADRALLRHAVGAAVRRARRATSSTTRARRRTPRRSSRAARAVARAARPRAAEARHDGRSRSSTWPRRSCACRSRSAWASARCSGYLIAGVRDRAVGAAASSRTSNRSCTSPSSASC